MRKYSTSSSFWIFLNNAACGKFPSLVILQPSSNGLVWGRDQSGTTRHTPHTHQPTVVPTCRKVWGPETHVLGCLLSQHMSPAMGQNFLCAPFVPCYAKIYITEIYYNRLRFSEVYYTILHCTKVDLTLLHFTKVCYNIRSFTDFYSTLLHFAKIHYTTLHYLSLIHI